ncbi:MAG TPA: helix-turn-helix domain-containing protein [Thermomicrobiales bacterium]|nr:helix-turn-helix domain-containing protein [Thermomicrobiales bacterium]
MRARAAAPAALAARLRGARRRRGWSPLALALRSGVALATVRDLEAGRAVRPSPLTLARLAAALGLPLDELAPATANDAAAEDEPDA